MPWPTAFLVLGALVTVTAFLAFAVRFSTETETEARTALDAALADRRAGLAAGGVGAAEAAG